METDASSASRSDSAAATLFTHVLVGIDDAPESLVAAAQAGALREPGGRLVLLGVAERYLASHAGLAASDAEEHVFAGTSEDLARAGELAQADETVLTTGRLVQVLARECRRRRATLIAVGARPHRRLSALALGGHDLEALHESSCSLLVARPGWGPHVPDRIVVALDGTPASEVAATVGRALARRLGCELLPVLGLADAGDLEAARAGHPDVLVDPGPLVDAVARATSRSSLLVVAGRADRASRHQEARLERMTYAASCSVLVVRDELEPAASPTP